MTQDPHHETWEDHWAVGPGGLGSLFGRLSAFVRRQVLSRAVRHYARVYFRRSGFYVEGGCGTGQSSSRIEASGRRLIALDFSIAALRSARRVPGFRYFIRGDVRRLPFAEGSLSGIWNLGVLEHFDAEAGRLVLEEFRRVLHPGGVALLFWPPAYGASRWILAPIEWARSRWSGRAFRFFPDEVNRLRSKAQARATVASAGLEAAAVHFTPRDGCIHMVVVARKPS